MRFSVYLDGAYFKSECVEDLNSLFQWLMDLFYEVYMLKNLKQFVTEDATNSICFVYTKDNNPISSCSFRTIQELIDSLKGMGISFIEFKGL